jgi:hypothetical protein
MRDRYKYTAIVKNESGKRVYSSTIYPAIERSSQDIYIISTRGDRLDLYAYKYYGNSREWIIIAIANKLGKGTLVVPPGMQIRIPPLDMDYDTKLLDINKEL